jgi:hypothetical protein
MFADSPACPGTPEGAHVWAMFPGGYGCHFCEAWRSLPRVGHYEEKSPVSLLLTHPIA